MLSSPPLCPSCGKDVEANPWRLGAYLLALEFIARLLFLPHHAQ